MGPKKSHPFLDTDTEILLYRNQRKGTEVPKKEVSMYDISNFDFDTTSSEDILAILLAMEDQDRELEESLSRHLDAA